MAEIGDVVRLTFDDGEVLEADPDEYRQLNGQGWSGQLVVLGRDADGNFVASFSTQEDLPDGCYVEAAVGRNAGGRIEIRGVLWKKSAEFVNDLSLGFGEQYPTGTRFCFDREAQIAGRWPPDQSLSSGKILPVTGRSRCSNALCRCPT